MIVEAQPLIVDFAEMTVAAVISQGKLPDSIVKILKVIVVQFDTFVIAKTLTAHDCLHSYRETTPGKTRPYDKLT